MKIKMKIKMKRKTKIVMLSTVFICLFMISFSSSTYAADPPTMTVDYNSQYEVQLLPIKVSVLFDWDEESLFNLQILYYVHLDWDIQSNVVTELYRVSYSYLDVGAVARPSSVILTIPAEGLNENHTVYFEITYEYKIGTSTVVEPPSKTYKVDILYEGELDDNARDNLILYICLGVAGAVVLIILTIIRRKRR